MCEAAPFDRISLPLLHHIICRSRSTARALEVEAGVASEHPSITAFRSAVLHGDWKNAERFLMDGLAYAASRKMAPRGLAEIGSSPPSAGLDLDVVLRDPVNRPLDVSSDRVLEHSPHSF